MKEKLSDIKIVADLDKALAENEIDGVVIATPTESHYQLGMKVLSSGYHLLMEKPLALTSDDCHELIEVADKAKKILMTGHIFLYNNAVIEMKKIMDSGEIGNTLYMRSIRSNLGPIRRDVNALWDLAAHDISIFNYLYEQQPIEVSCTGHSILAFSQEDIAQASIIYPGGKVATLFVSWLDPQKQRGITVIGDKKMLFFDDMNPKKPLTVYSKGVKFEDQRSYVDTFEGFRLALYEGEMIQPNIDTGEPLKAECWRFVNCILNGEKPLTDGENGLEIVSILEAMSLSMSKRGAPVSIWNG